MKTAIYIEDGVVQLVITPETEFEKNALSSFSKDSLKAEIFSGGFYDCRGGWVRQKDHFPSHTIYGEGNGGDDSLILRVDKDKE